MTTADYLNQLQQDREDFIDNLETKGITGLTGDETFTELVPEVLNIPSSILVEEKDVNFYDYDGTRVYSYTKTEFLLLDSMPTNPSHEGLISQGWNWSLADAKTCVTNFGKLDIGQMYITDDNATRIYVHVTDKILNPYCGFAVDGTATINWGDETTPDTITGSNTTNLIYTQHHYANAGDYVISISSENKIYLVADANNTCPLFTNNMTGDGLKRPYIYAIRKIELGNVSIGDYIFKNCAYLNNITIPVSVTSIGINAFIQCYALSNIIIPSNMVNIGNSTFNACYSLKTISIPSSVTSIGSDAFRYCYSLGSIIIPNVTTINNNTFRDCNNLKYAIIPSASSVGSYVFSDDKRLSYIELPSATSLATYAFNNCNSIMYVIAPSLTSISTYSFNNIYACIYYDFSGSTAIPTLANVNSFNSINLETKIVVPDNLYENWINANVWKNFSSQIIKKSDWDNL